MIVVGITGGFGSGKTEVTRVFKTKGAGVFDADAAARKAVRRGSPVYRAIVKIFGKVYLKKNQELDRKKLAERVFRNPKDLHKLDVLIHPGVIFEMFKQIRRNRRRKGIFVMDVPLLFESRMEGLVDATVVVSARREIVLERAKKKGMSRSLALGILASQRPLGKKERLADYVIRNNGSLKELRVQVVELIEKIKKEYKQENR